MGRGILTISLIAVLLIGVISFDDAFAVEERFDNLGPTFTTSELVKPDFRVTGSNTINVVQFNGLGIIGGCQDGQIGSLESITITFNPNLASNIVIDVNPLARGDIHAFDANGASLGTQLSGGGGGNISQLFGNVPISKFTFTGHVEDFSCPGGSLVKINYDSVIPPPTDTELILTELQQISQQLITGLTDIGNSLTSIQNQLLAILGLLEDPTTGLVAIKDAVDGIDGGSGSIPSETQTQIDSIETETDKIQMLKDDVEMLKSQITSMDEKLDTLIEAIPPVFTEKECGKFQKDADKDTKKGKEVPPEIIANLAICAELYP